MRRAPPVGTVVVEKFAIEPMRIARLADRRHPSEDRSRPSQEDSAARPNPTRCCPRAPQTRRTHRTGWMFPPGRGSVVLRRGRSQHHVLIGEEDRIVGGLRLIPIAEVIDPAAPDRMSQPPPELSAAACARPRPCPSIRRVRYRPDECAAGSDTMSDPAALRFGMRHAALPRRSQRTSATTKVEPPMKIVSAGAASALARATASGTAATVSPARPAAAAREANSAAGSARSPAACVKM